MSKEDKVNSASTRAWKMVRAMLMQKGARTSQVLQQFTFLAQVTDDTCWPSLRCVGQTTVLATYNLKLGSGGAQWWHVRAVIVNPVAAKPGPQ